MGNCHHTIRRSIAVIIAVLVSLAYAARARAVVTADPIPAPLNGFVGMYRGSSCVAVGNYWFLTAKHTGDPTNQAILMRGQMYTVLEAVPHPTLDLQLLRVAEELPGYHRLADDVHLGDPCVLGGWGATAGAPLSNNTGFDWNGPHLETWGENMIDGEGMLLAVRFDAPTSTWAVPHEATFAVNDSGGGLFVPGPAGTLSLAGIAVSVSGWGSSQYTSASFCVNVSLFRNWMAPIVDPTQPVSSGVEAPRAMLSLPGLPAWIAGLIAVLPLASLRRRD